MEETCRDCELYTQGVCSVYRKHREPEDTACDEFKLVDVFELIKE